MKNAYELMILVKPTTEVTDKNASDIVTGLIGDVAKITDVTVLGKKQLAYPIQKFTEAYYILTHFKNPNVSVHEIEKKVQLGNIVLRFLLTT